MRELHPLFTTNSDGEKIVVTFTPHWIQPDDRLDPTGYLTIGLKNLANEESAYFNMDLSTVRYLRGMSLSAPFDWGFDKERFYAHNKIDEEGFGKLAIFSIKFTKEGWFLATYVAKAKPTEGNMDVYDNNTITGDITVWTDQISTELIYDRLCAALDTLCYAKLVSVPAPVSVEPAPAPESIPTPAPTTKVCNIKVEDESFFLEGGKSIATVTVGKATVPMIFESGIDVVKGDVLRGNVTKVGDDFICLSLAS